MIPRWSPESARMCEAPASLKAVTVSFGRALLSPVRRALRRADVPGSENGMPSRRSESHPIASDAHFRLFRFSGNIPHRNELAEQKKPQIRNRRAIPGPGFRGRGSLRLVPDRRMTASASVAEYVSEAAECTARTLTASETARPAAMPAANGMPTRAKSLSSTISALLLSCKDSEKSHQSA